MNRTVVPASFALTFLAGCSAPPPKVEIPPLTPQTAATLLEFNSKAKTWLETVRKQNTSCGYKLDLPDQNSHPDTIDIDHAMSCAGRPSPRELDASVSFAYDKAAGHWTVSRFSS